MGTWTALTILPTSSETFVPLLLHFLTFIDRFQTGVSTMKAIQLHQLLFVMIISARAHRTDRISK